MTYVNGAIGTSTATVTWNGTTGTSARWAAAAVFVGLHSYIFTLACSSSNWVLLYDGVDSGGGNHHCASLTLNCWTLHDFTCSPVHAHFKEVSPPPFACGGDCSDPGNGAFTDIYFDL